MGGECGECGEVVAGPPYPHLLPRPCNPVLVTSVPPYHPPPLLPRSSYSGGPCPSYIVGSPGCAAFAPTLANVPSGYTQLLFDSAGGNKNRYYIRQAVSDAAGWGEAASSEPGGGEGSERPSQRNQHQHASGVEAWGSKAHQPAPLRCLHC